MITKNAFVFQMVSVVVMLMLIGVALGAAPSYHQERPTREQLARREAAQKLAKQQHQELMAKEQKVNIQQINETGGHTASQTSSVSDIQVPRPFHYQNVFLNPVPTEKKSKIVSILTSQWLDIAYEEFIVIDIETTGLSKQFDYILEVAAIKYRHGKESCKFVTLIKPPIPIPEEVIEIHGITNHIVKDAPTIEEVIPKLIDFLGDSLLVGHNANFDVGFIEIWARRCGYDPVWSYVDTKSVAKKFLPNLPDYKQATVLDAIGCTQNQYHRAEADCRGCAEIMLLGMNTLIDAKPSPDTQLPESRQSSNPSVEKETIYTKQKEYESTECLSPYEHLNNALTAINDLKEGYSKAAEQRALDSIKASESYPNMSTYQLSNAYKQFGEAYVSCDEKAKALSAFTHGLELNRDLAVKKKIKTLMADGIVPVEGFFYVEKQKKKERPQRHIELEEAAKKRSEKFTDKHRLKIEKIDVSKLKKIGNADISLSPLEIYFLRKINKRTTEHPDIAGYWTHDYQMDFQRTLERLISGGYLELSCVEFTLSKCTMVELKEILKTYTIKPDLSGKKDELIQRVFDSIPRDMLEDEFFGKYFVVSDKGHLLINESGIYTRDDVPVDS